ncbi:hypothetical protein POPTR_010G231366v4 [Populus trichocarpa]|uniref:AT3G52170-like helix-turn-helix domain-containing protein n=1 Tax=Populus trichocarpa TaxID=3694 RepID=A0A3N7HC09_POPTR|nr:hypothetical protein BDE02_10G207800 [Populus trichocarpa]RQO97134.2 hypothetical protein POPTR_010G231366v4 [Populus trichocarpa]
MLLDPGLRGKACIIGLVLIVFFFPLLSSSLSARVLFRHSCFSSSRYLIFLWDSLFALFTWASSFSAPHPGHLLLFLQLNPLPVEKASPHGKLYHVCSLLIQQ